MLQPRDGWRPLKAGKQGKAEMTDTFIGIMRDVEASLQIATMTHEYEIIACFFDYDSRTANELADFSGCSSSGFFNVLKRLEGRKIIYSQSHPLDKRSKVYRLSETAAEYIRHGRANYGVATFEEWRRTNGNSNLLQTYSANIRRTMGIRHLTCEYQILLSLYYRSGITNMEFTDIIDASLTKFNSSLRTLSDMGLIFPERDPTDKRIKRYYISDASRNVIEDAYRRLFKWGQGISLLGQVKTIDRKRIS